MRVDDILELTIEGQGMDGEGVARKDGIVVFVPYTLIGEVVKCKVTLVKKSFAQARVFKIITPSQYRIAPVCEAYFKCGGCDFLHIKDSAHASLKKAELINNFKKIAGENITVDEYVNSDVMQGYRNKVQLPFGMVGGVANLGYYANKSHEVIPHKCCVLHAEWADKLSKIVLNYVRARQISVYDEKSGKGLMRHLVMRKVADTVAIVLVVNGDSLPFINGLVKDIQASNIDFSLHININKEDTNTIMSDKLSLVHGKAYISTEILGIKAEVSPLSFMQVNDYIRDKIYTKAMELMSTANVAIDLYSGIGITSNILAKTCDKVYSIEITPDAVANAKSLAIANGNDEKIITVCGDVAVELPKLIDTLRADDGNFISQNKSTSQEELDADNKKNTKQKKLQSIGEGNNKNSKCAILIDPPRKGCDQSTIDAILLAAPEIVVYISCNHATLARDFAALKDKYVITHLSAYDMFPNTHHLETLVCLTRK